MKVLTNIRQMASMAGHLPHLPALGMPTISAHMPKTGPKSLFTRDYPEVLLLYAWLSVAGCFGIYSLKKTLFDNDAGAFLNVNMRGDIDRQFGEKVGAEPGKYAAPPATNVKHTFWWRLAQVKTDEDGANIGILWDNRKRPHQYSKPGTAGIGSGISMAAL